METMHAEPTAVRPGPQPAIVDNAKAAHERLVGNFDRHEVLISRLEDALQSALVSTEASPLIHDRPRENQSPTAHALNNAADRLEDLGTRLAFIVDRIDLP